LVAARPRWATKGKSLRAQSRFDFRMGKINLLMVKFVQNKQKFFTTKTQSHQEKLY
jgi:hypothetical protein